MIYCTVICARSKPAMNEDDDVNRTAMRTTPPGFGTLKLMGTSVVPTLADFTDTHAPEALRTKIVTLTVRVAATRTTPESEPAAAGNSISTRACRVPDVVLDTPKPKPSSEISSASPPV
jgi:hypothetical protein